MKKAEIKKLHKRLARGEHILLVDYGNIEKHIFSCWYTEDSQGKYLQIVALDDAYIVSISDMSTRKVMAIGLDNGENIKNYEAANTELRFLESDRLIEEPDNLSSNERKISDYQTLLPLVNSAFKNKSPYIDYKNELDHLISDVA